jgi:GrpB-like predicted nucleotidyltransferase (UPF0157 family)
MKFYRENQYRPRCEGLFSDYREKIHRLIPSARVEHIGSSSIPGLISKGDLDIFVGVNPQVHERSVTMLTSLGFKIKENTLKTPELCMLGREDQDVALQVVVNGSRYEFFIEFRDKLIHSPELLKRYNDLKKSCVSLGVDEYRERKSNFIEQILGLDRIRC